MDEGRFLIFLLVADATQTPPAAEDHSLGVQSHNDMGRNFFFCLFSAVSHDRLHQILKLLDQHGPMEVEERTVIQAEK
jgi:hypothetical protein